MCSLMNRFRSAWRVWIWGLILLLPLLPANRVKAQTVTGIAATYRNGQIFITWNNIPGADSGFYYVYAHNAPITEANIQQASYLGRAPYNSAYNFRLTYALRNENKKEYFVINDAPKQVLDSTQGFFVMNCTQAGTPTYFAVRSDYGKSAPNWQVVEGANATTAAVTQQLDPVRAYFVQKVKAGGKNDTMEVYVHYGSNVAVGNYPDMTNEGCLAFHFGIIKKGSGSNLPMYVKFHGGNGDFINAAITTNLGDCWKVSVDDWIPAFKQSSDGGNTRWLGYHEGLNIYELSSSTAPPTSGTIRAYTYRRIDWTLRWLTTYWPGAVDTSRIYLNGVSMGCGGALLHAMVKPHAYVGVVLSDGKFNTRAPEDSNPDCKFNEGNSSRNELRRIWGHEDTLNLFTDLPKPDKPAEFFRVYDLTNTNHMLHYNQYRSLPVIYAINGKNDQLTCWEEKVLYFDTVQQVRAGGFYYWDLRTHDGGDSKWPVIKLSRLSPLSNKSSYPAFSNGELDSNPGSAVNPSPPYYSGDNIGSLHGFYQWDPASVRDSAHAWQVRVWIEQDTLKDDSIIPATLPGFAKADITLRRTQQFKGFAKNTTLYWCNIRNNGDTIKIGTIKQRYSGSTPKPLTIKKVKIYPEGNTIRVQTTPLTRQSVLVLPNRPVVDVFPNPAGDYVQVSAKAANLTISVRNLWGSLLYQDTHRHNEAQKPITIRTADWPSGIYWVDVLTEDSRVTLPVVIQ